MKTALLLVLILLLPGIYPARAAATGNVETIVFLRHGEKPPGGLGQLSPQGQRRALALPSVLIGKFGQPDAIFAPDPAVQKDDDGTLYSYVRPLATIEPTAIRCGLPVNAQIGYTDIKALGKELTRPAYRHATIFVVWEHHNIEDLVRKMLKKYGGDAHDMPKWHTDNFDYLFVLRITDDQTITFTLDHEGLDSLVRKE